MSLKKFCERSQVVCCTGAQFLNLLKSRIDNKIPVLHEEYQQFCKTMERSLEMLLDPMVVTDNLSVVTCRPTTIGSTVDGMFFVDQGSPDVPAFCIGAYYTDRFHVHTEFVIGGTKHSKTHEVPSHCQDPNSIIFGLLLHVLEAHGIIFKDALNSGRMKEKTNGR
jgi:hypothetical protein